VDLTVTSPPYPMIAMWDDAFADSSPTIRDALDRQDGRLAFELMHQELDLVWKELYRVIKNGGLAAVNIGDAARTIGVDFNLFMNHARVMSGLLSVGFQALPSIIWRKQTNAPNKFMGAGMLPAGAYVTLEHEFILIVRKGPKREFARELDKRTRRASAIFWEERNTWFSDIWTDLKGTTQDLNNKKTRARSGAFPFELAYRLINMFSIKGDLVLDPFLGTGTTTAAAMASGRNSVGFEVDSGLRPVINSKIDAIQDFSNAYIRDRLNRHLYFIEARTRDKGKPKYENIHYKFPVMTRQETELILNDLTTVSQKDDSQFEVGYSDNIQEVSLTRNP